MGNFKIFKGLFLMVFSILGFKSRFKFEFILGLSYFFLLIFNDFNGFELNLNLYFGNY